MAPWSHLPDDAMPTPVPPPESTPAASEPSPRGLALIRSEADLAALPASERIRYRLVGADCRFHANDNISEFVRPGETEELKAEVAAKMQEVLRSLVIDTDSDHNTQETAKRVAKMFVDEVFRGRYRRCRRSPSSPTSRGSTS